MAQICTISLEFCIVRFMILNVRFTIYTRAHEYCTSVCHFLRHVVSYLLILLQIPEKPSPLYSLFSIGIWLLNIKVYSAIDIFKRKNKGYYLIHRNCGWYWLTFSSYLHTIKLQSHCLIIYCSLQRRQPKDSE